MTGGATSVVTKGAITTKTAEAAGCGTGVGWFPNALHGSRDLVKSRVGSQGPRQEVWPREPSRLKLPCQKTGTVVSLPTLACLWRLLGVGRGFGSKVRVRLGGRVSTRWLGPAPGAGLGGRVGRRRGLKARWPGLGRRAEKAERPWLGRSQDRDRRSQVSGD